MMSAAFELAWSGAEINWEDEAASKAGALATLETYLRETPIPADERPEAVEVAVDMSIPGLPALVGVLDLVRAGGIIVDFKTSARSPVRLPSPPRFDLQVFARGNIKSSTSTETPSRLFRLSNRSGRNRRR